jgi:uncharacterized glyoxalase superfamily protein PhnB
MRQTVTPYLLYEDIDVAVDFLTRAFGFREVERMTGQAGGTHVELEVADDGARIYVGSPGGDFRGPDRVGRTSLTYVLVDDVDRHHDTARAAAATIIEELTSLAYGDRRYSCRDAGGHEWTFASPIGADATDASSGTPTESRRDH